MNGAELIAQERKRQIEVEGYNAQEDAEYFDHKQLANAAACYALFAGLRKVSPPADWPWRDTAWKPKDTQRDLVRAGALIAAAIDRLQQLQGDGE